MDLIHTPDERIAVADVEAMVDVTLALVEGARSLALGVLCAGLAQLDWRPASDAGVGVKIGVVKEIKPQEARVALTPAGARELVARGHDVVVEAGAGEGSGFPDEAYVSAGAALAPCDEVWEAQRAAAQGQGAARRGVPAAAPRASCSSRTCTSRPRRS